MKYQSACLGTEDVQITLCWLNYFNEILIKSAFESGMVLQILLNLLSQSRSQLYFYYDKVILKNSGATWFKLIWTLLFGLLVLYKHIEKFVKLFIFIHYISRKVHLKDHTLWDYMRIILGWWRDGHRQQHPPRRGSDAGWDCSGLLLLTVWLKYCPLGREFITEKLVTLEGSQL